jgi:hypothetical protein
MLKADTAAEGPVHADAAVVEMLASDKNDTFVVPD